MKILLFLGCLFTTFLVTYSQSEQNRILDKMNTLFESMKNEDGQLCRSLFVDSAMMKTISVKDGKTIINSESAEKFITAVGSEHKKTWNEKIYYYDIKVDRNFATVWTDYVFFYGEEILHCGVNAFQFVKIENDWKILSITDTRSKDKCKLKIQQDSTLKAEINIFMNAWHKNAANAEIEFFDKIADEGIYIGTDITEHWTKEEFYDWSKKIFERDKAWDFKPKERNIYLSKDSNYAWFDEILDTWMGDCRASGVLKKAEGKWLIEHYHLAMTIPNEIVKDYLEFFKSKTAK